MKWTIFSGGQTGVDTGAILGAADCHLEVGGWAPAGWRTEVGTVFQGHRLHHDARVLSRGGLLEDSSPRYESRTARNVEAADLLLLVVPSVLHPDRSPGTALTLDMALRRRRHMPVLATDGSQLEAVKHWLRVQAVALRRLDREATTSERWGPWTGDIRLMVAGPRESTWAEGQRVARAVVYGIFATVTRSDSRQLELPL